MKLYIKSSQGLPTLEEAIKGYTAQGGELAVQYPFTHSMKQLLYSEASNNKIKLQHDIWRKIDLSESDVKSIFDKIYEDNEYVVNIDKLESFTEDRQRAFTFGGTHLQYVLYKIPAGAEVNGLDIQQDSVYPQEHEILVGKNTFKANYLELEWTHSNNMILTLHSV